MFFETRKHKDLYIWVAKTPNGPSAKFHVTNGKISGAATGLALLVLRGCRAHFNLLRCAVHTMAELKLSGNHLKGSRPVLSFDATFDEQPHLQVLKEMFTHVFSTPRRHHKSKPFFDHVLSFSVADGRIWMRNYQVVPDPAAKKKEPDAVSLVEVGPRACMNPIKMFAGAFGGPLFMTILHMCRPMRCGPPSSASRRASTWPR